MSFRLFPASSTFYSYCENTSKTLMRMVPAFAHAQNEYRWYLKVGVFGLKLSNDFIKLYKPEGKTCFGRRMLGADVIYKWVDEFLLHCMQAHAEINLVYEEPDPAAGRWGESFQVWLCSLQQAFWVSTHPGFGLEKAQTHPESRKQARTCKEERRIPSAPLKTIAQVRNLQLLNGFHNSSS